MGEIILKTAPDMMAVELLEPEVGGRTGGSNSESILSLIASAMRIDRLRSSSLMVEGAGLSWSDSKSSAKPATYMSIASSTVIPMGLEIGLSEDSTIDSYIDVSLVTTLLLSVLVVSI